MRYARSTQDHVGVSVGTVNNFFFLFILTFQNFNFYGPRVRFFFIKPLAIFKNSMLLLLLNYHLTSISIRKHVNLLWKKDTG